MRTQNGSARSTPAPEGLYPLCKPPGMTSHDVVALVRRVTSERHTGHAGTLDPAAAGVLLALVGARATRLSEYLLDLPKTYVAEVVFGVATDTQDYTGHPVGGDPAAATRLERAEVLHRLNSFVGCYEQLPPMISAVKVGGERLYRAAATGTPVERSPRRVVIHRLDLLEYGMPDGPSPPGVRLTGGSRSPGLPWARVRVTCSKGTYVRTLAHDLGAALGTGAHLGFLLREAVGAFTLDSCMTLEELATAAACGHLEAVAVPPAVAVAHLPEVRPAPPELALLVRGTAIPWSPVGLGPEVRVLGPEGSLALIARVRGGRLEPHKVLIQAGNARPPGDHERREGPRDR